MAYAVFDDVHQLGLSARAFVVVPRAFNSDNGRGGDTIDTAGSTGVIRMAGHGYTSADLVDMFLIASGGALPTGAVTGALLVPAYVDSFRFKLYTQTGTLVTYTTAGSGWGIQIDPERRLQRHLDDGASRIDRALVAQSPPIKVDPITGKYPPEIIGLNARLAARSAIPSLQFEVAAFRQAADRVLAAEKADEAMLAEWMAGKPLLPQGLDQGLNGAQDAPRAQSKRPWGFERRRL